MPECKQCETKEDVNWLDPEGIWLCSHCISKKARHIIKQNG